MPQVSPQAFLYFALYIAHFEICIKNFMTSLSRQKYTQEVHFRQFQGWSKNFIFLRFWNAHGIILQSKTCFPQTKFKGINGDRIRWIWGQIWSLLKKGFTCGFYACQKRQNPRLGKDLTRHRFISFWVLTHPHHQERFRSHGSFVYFQYERQR